MPSNFGDLARRFDSRGKAITPAVIQGVKDVMDITMGTLHGATSHQAASTEDLRKAGHPYGRGRVVGGSAAIRRRRGQTRLAKGAKTTMRGPLPMAPQFINRQTGKLQRAFNRQMGWSRTKISGAIYNTADYAKYLFSVHGTKYMIARDTVSWAMRFTAKERRAVMLAAWRRGKR